MKTLVKTIVIPLILPTLIFILTWQVKAQESFLNLSIYPVMATLNSEVQNEIVVSVETFLNSISFYYEKEIELEDWMLDTGKWSNNPSQSDHYDFLIEQQEQEITLEDWMLEPFLTDLKNLDLYLIPEKEEDLKLENWMLDKSQWLRKK